MRPRKKRGNYVLFMASMRRYYCALVDATGGKIKHNTRYYRDQYQLLCDGIRNVLISDAGCSAWMESGGEV